MTGSALAHRRTPRTLLVAFVFLLACCGTPGLHAQLLGSEFQVNSTTTNYQNRPAVARAGADGFVVVWDSGSQDGSGRGVVGRRFDATANPLGVEFLVNQLTTGAQGLAAVASDATGEFVVAWTNYLPGGSLANVSARRYDAAGTPLASEFQVNAFSTGDQKGAAVASDPSGNFAVVWWSVGQDGSAEGVYTRRFDSAGVPIAGETRVNDFTTGQQWLPAVTADGAGQFVVVWSSDGQDGSSHGVFARRLDAAGTPLGSDIPVNQFTTGIQTSPSVAADLTGGFVVVWASYGQDGSGQGIYGRRFDVNGSPTSNERRINAFTPSDQTDPAIAGDGEGGFVVTWQGEDLSNAGIVARRLDASGAPAGVEFPVNTFTGNAQLHPAIAAIPSGEFVVAWDSSFQDGDSDGVFGRRVVGGMFYDGFESSEVCGWSSAVGAAPCP